MKKQKNLLVTFDYELFLGHNSGSVSRCIIEPTALLIKVLEKYKISAIFFIDTVYLIKLREKALIFPKAKIDYDNIVHQLEDLAKKGYYLFPHIHAHWLDAEYNPDLNLWSLKDFSKYRFHNLDEKTKFELFDGSIEFLYDTIPTIKRLYAIDSYRAGGWCIQPFESFKHHFLKHNITNDFSVIPGQKSFSDVNYFDFENAKKNIYFFENDILNDESGTFCEFPISIMAPNLIQRIIFRIETKILWHLKLINLGDGNAARFAKKSYKNHIHNILSIDTMLRTKIPIYKNFIKKNNYIHIVSHPKMLSFYNVKLFENFLEDICMKYFIISDYKKIKTRL